MTTPITDPSSSLQGLRLLVVEDKMIMAMSLDDLLTLAGCRVTRAGRLSRALELAGTEALDGALLDINLRGEKVFPVAAALDRRDIPFIFLTGYGADHVDPPWRERPMLEKPYEPEALLQLIGATVTA